MKTILSKLASWSPKAGMTYFLPELLFPFVVNFKGNEIFIIETIIALLNYLNQVFFEFYPGCPFKHFVIAERIIKKENRSLFDWAKTNQFDLSSLMWKHSCTLYSNALTKNQWLQMADFIILFNHKPEMIVYFSAAFVLAKAIKIKKSQTAEAYLSSCDQYDELFPLVKCFRKALELYKNYSGYNKITYKPFEPFTENYPDITNFPVEFLETAAQMREQLQRETYDFKQTVKEENKIEKTYKDIMKKEQDLLSTYKSMVDAQKTKSELIEKETRALIYQKEKLNKQLRHEKIEKVKRVTELVDQNIKFYGEMQKAENSKTMSELNSKRALQSTIAQERLAQEELNKLDYEANKRLFDLMNLANKTEISRQIEKDTEIRHRKQELENKLMESKLVAEDKVAEKKQKLNLNEMERKVVTTKQKGAKLKQREEAVEDDYEHRMDRQIIENERLRQSGNMAETRKSDYGQTDRVKVREEEIRKRNDEYMKNLMENDLDSYDESENDLRRSGNN